MKKRFFCLLLAAAVFTTAIPVDASVSTQKMVQTQVVHLGTYHMDSNGTWKRLASLRGTITEAPAEAEITAAPVFQSTTEAGAYLRTQMKQHAAHILLRVKGAYDEETISVFHEAVAHTGISDEGDYLMTITDTSDAGAWQMDGEVLYAYDFTYRTTLAEEQELTEALKAIEAQIPWGDTADEEMHAVRGAYRYLIQTYAYDSASYEKHKQGITTVAQDMRAAQSYTAYGAYKQKQAVCQGLAGLLYRILLDRGIDNRIISSSTHAWNAVKVEDEWYMCDATGDVQKGFSDVPEHYLLSRDDLKDMGSAYDWNTSTMWDYNVVDAYNWASRAWNDLTASVIRDFKNLVKLVKGNPSGKQKATLVDTDGKKLKEGKDYTVSYEYGNYENGKYNSKAVYTGTGSYSGTVEKYFNRTIEAPQIVKVEQKVLDTKRDSVYRYYIQTDVYVKPPTWLLSAKLDKTSVDVGIYFLGEPYATEMAYKQTEQKIMKDGTYRFTVRRKMATLNGKSKLAYRKQIIIAAYTAIHPQNGATISHVGNLTKGYVLPTIDGNISAKTKRTYKPSQLKKMKKVTITSTYAYGDYVKDDSSRIYYSIEFSKKLYK